MRSNPRLGLVNFALVSAYFVPVWGHEALRVLTSPFNGFEDRAHAVAAVYYRDLFDFGLAGLIRTSELLAGIKMVIAAAFLATGNVKKNFVPRPCSLSTQIWPPCASTIPFAIGNPSPHPSPVESERR